MAPQQPVALVTGCSSGIGKQIALAFASSGVQVLATARKVESLRELTSQHKNIAALALDLDDLGNIASLRDAVVKRTDGGLDYLVNNAGTHYAATAMDLRVEEAAQLFMVNVFAVMQLCQTFVPLLRKSAHGRIVQIGSVTRDVPVVWQGAYNASKAALSQYSKTLRLELAPFGVSVVEVVTGFVQSNILHHGLYAPDDSLYLPIKETMENIKYQGNHNGMMADDYARSVVSKLLAGSTGPEIWEGNGANYVRFLVAVLPQRLLNWILFRNYQLDLLRGR